MLFIFLLVVQAIIATALVAVILMQQSEGGGLGMGGSPSGLMNARGAADFLTRATTVLATIFVLMSIGLAVLAASQRGTRAIDTSLARPAGAVSQPAAPAPAPPAVPLAEGETPAPATSAPAPASTPGAPAPQQ
jgi:preprotein translocase subunit SecG